MSILFNDPEFDFMFVVMSSPSVVCLFEFSYIFSVTIWFFAPEVMNNICWGSAPPF